MPSARPSSSPPPPRRLPAPRTRACATSSARCAPGKVELLVIAGANPVYAAPADLDFAAALDKVPLQIHHGLYLDETAERCHWHLPASHPLESWGDLRAVDGTVSIVQPLIAPLYNTISETELLAGFTGEGSEQKAYEIVRERWQKELGEGGLREALESRPPRRCRRGHGVRAEGGEGRGPATGRGPRRRRRAAGSRSRSGPTRASTTAASRTSAGCRSCRSRSARSRGRTPRS